MQYGCMDSARMANILIKMFRAFRAPRSPNRSSRNPPPPPPPPITLAGMTLQYDFQPRNGHHVDTGAQILP